VTSGGDLGGTKPKPRPRPDNGLPEENGSSSTQTADQAGAQLGQRAGYALGSLVLVILFSLIFFGIWWRRLFRNYGIAAQIYGRMGVLANWAGIPLQRWQTPYEYIKTVSTITPEETKTLERFGDIYVRELWADPKSPEHPRASGEVKELPSLWKRLQPRFFMYLLRHPYFLRAFPARTWKIVSTFVAKRRARRAFEHDL